MAVRMTWWTSPAVFTMLSLFACGDEKVVDTATRCDAPVSSAGADVSGTLGALVTLDGSASTFCEKYADQVTFTWTFESVPAGSALDESALSDNRTATAVAPGFAPDAVGDYTLHLVVSDPDATSAEDVVVVHVTSTDNAPIADCGPNVEGKIGEAATLDGSLSNDPEGAELSFSWSLTDVPDCSTRSSSDIFNPGGPTPSVVPDCDGIYTVSLVVSDGVQYSEPDICTINVASSNRPPVADAGESEELGSCADNPISLDAYGSYDLDGDEITYQWTVIEVPSGSASTDTSFSDSTAADPKFTWDIPGSYTFQVQVYDGTDWSSPDIVTYLINEESENHRPSANAGDDVTIEAESDCEASSYVWTCADCEEQQLELDGSASFDPEGDELSYTWNEATGTVIFSSRYSALSSGVIPAQSATYGVATTMSLTVELSVADCQLSDNDTFTVSYSCTGQKP
jgi:hypothetical protein